MEPISTEIFVLGAGPGGYAAAFYAADKGKKVTLVEQNPAARRRVYERRLHSVQGIAACYCGHARVEGVVPNAASNLARSILIWTSCARGKNRSSKNSARELKLSAQHRNVEVVHGRGHFEDSQTLRVETDRRPEIYPLRKSHHRGRLQAGHAQRFRPRQSHAS